MEDDWECCFVGEAQVIELPYEPVIHTPAEKLSADELIKAARVNEYIPEKNQEVDIKSQSIDDILRIKHHEKSSCELIQMQCSMTYYIQTLTEKKICSASATASSGDFHQPSASVIVFEQEDTKTVLEYFQWISKTSQELARRIGQSVSIPIPGNEIQRSSYNFCKRSTLCKLFYSKVESPTCPYHHYVHALLKHDVDSVINYLKYILSNSGTITMSKISNLNSSINTICYVARRMSKEISFIDQRTEGGSEEFHRDNPTNPRASDAHDWDDNLNEFYSATIPHRPKTVTEMNDISSKRKSLGLETSSRINYHQNQITSNPVADGQRQQKKRIKTVQKGKTTRPRGGNIYELLSED
jgi:hypothetical protein